MGPCLPYTNFPVLLMYAYTVRAKMAVDSVDRLSAGFDPVHAAPLCLQRSAGTALPEPRRQRS